MRQPPGQELVGAYAERVDVGRRARLLAARLLGREVRRGAEHRADLRDPGLLGRLRDPEVGELGGAHLLREQEVAGLHVAVHDSGAVRVVEAVAGVAHEPDRLVDVEPLALAQHVRGRRPVHVLHDDVVAVRARVLTRVEHLHDVRVLEPRGRQRLAAEAVHERLVVGEVLREQLHSDGPLQHRVARLEDGGHPAGAQAALEHVAAGDLGRRAHSARPSSGRPGSRRRRCRCPVPFAVAVAVSVVRERRLVRRGRGRVCLVVGLGRRRSRSGLRRRRLRLGRVGWRGVRRLLAGGLSSHSWSTRSQRWSKLSWSADLTSASTSSGIESIRSWTCCLFGPRGPSRMSLHAPTLPWSSRACVLVELRLKAGAPCAAGIRLPSSSPPQPATATASDERAPARICAARALMAR